jgi:hypothetical protein
MGLSWEATCLVPAHGTPPSDSFALWLGSVDDALNIDALKKRGISAIVNMASGSCDEEKSRVKAKDRKRCTAEEIQFVTAEFTESWYRQSTGRADFLYLSIAAEDGKSYPIWKSFDKVTMFLRGCREAGRPVLVHCMQGVNRSAAVCTAFLAREGVVSKGGGSGEGCGVFKAVDWISRRRPVLENRDFLHQLLEYGSPQHAWEDVALCIERIDHASALDTCAVVEPDPEEALNEVLPCGDNRSTIRHEAPPDREATILMNMAKCVVCQGARLLPGLASCELCPLCDGVAGWPEVLPSVLQMNQSGDVGDAIRKGFVFREIRSMHDEETVRVYQAYNTRIANSACKANSFHGPLEDGTWSASRMTWIKPSAVWMAYRCGWSVMKDKNQSSVLALDLSKPKFLDLLKTAMLSHGGDPGDTKEQPVVVQWDPERLMCTDTTQLKDKDAYTCSIQEMRSIQIGLRGKGVEMLLDPGFVLKITDVTDDFQRAHAALSARHPNTAAAVAALWPDRQETLMIVPYEVRDGLQMDVPFSASE